MCRTLRNLQYTDMIFVMGKKEFYINLILFLVTKKKNIIYTSLIFLIQLWLVIKASKRFQAYTEVERFEV